MDESTDPESVAGRRLCHRCIGEVYLKNEVRHRGRTAQCFYCHKIARFLTVAELAERIDTAFQVHYRRTSDQPDSVQMMMLADKESQYSWYREGLPTIEAFGEAAEIDEVVAADVQTLLEDKYADFDSWQMGDETEYQKEVHYEQVGPDAEQWQAEWQDVERSLSLESRYFNESASIHLAIVFSGIDTLATSDGRSLVVTMGPNTEGLSLFRARVFQAEASLKEALGQPDIHLGPPPPRLARAGRMNAAGQSVFYGATSARTAIAEVRPPVGSRVVVAQFGLVRPVRLLDLGAVALVTERGSIFDPATGQRLERAVFLRSLSQRMSRTVMPDDEPIEYVATQAIADFLSNENEPRLDGILFPSAQTHTKSQNVVLFHKAARVAPIMTPPGSKFETSIGTWDEEGFSTDYSVWIAAPGSVPQEPSDKSAHTDAALFPSHEVGSGEALRDLRLETLRLALDTVEVHHVNSVEVTSEAYPVRRSTFSTSEETLEYF